MKKIRFTKGRSPGLVKGQALITLLFFTLMAVTICSAAVIIIMTNSISGSKLEQGVIAYEIAKSGAENAKLRLLRDPGYLGETNLTIGQGKVDIQVVDNSGTYTITSTGYNGNFKRIVQFTATYQNYALTFSPIKEIY